MSDPTPVLVAVLRERVDDCADRALRRLREALPALRDITPPGLWDDLRTVVDLTLTLLAEHREPTAAELAWYRGAGARYAQQGAAFDDITRGVHVVQRVFWEILRDVARGHPDPRASRLLVQRSATIWKAFDAMSSATTEGHRAVVSRLDLDARRRALAWLEALRLDGLDLSSLTRSFELDPAGPFVAGVHAGTCERDAGGPWGIVIEQRGHTVVFAQPAGDPIEAEAALAEQLASARVPAGVGLARSDLTGARQSLSDAMLAYRAARRIGAVTLRFRDAWLIALAVEHRGVHDALLADAVEFVRRERRVAEALRAYLHASGNLSRAGQTLGLHPNTIAYRLRQFADRASVDPRSASGRALAQVVLALAGGGGGSREAA